MTYDELQEKQDQLMQYIRTEFGEGVYSGLGNTEFLNDLDDICFQAGVVEDEE